MVMNSIRVSVWLLGLIAAAMLFLHSPATAQSGTTTSDPQVEIYSPGDGTTVSGRVPVQFTSMDADGIVKFELYVDGELKQTIYPTARNLYFMWNASKDGKGDHELCVRAYDKLGNVGTSTSCYVHVYK